MVTLSVSALYNITKTLAAGCRNSEVPVKDVNGNVSTDVIGEAQRSPSTKKREAI